MKTLRFKLYEHKRNRYLKRIMKKGKRVVYVDRWFPSSKTCSSCGHVLGQLGLETRHWRCPACSTENDRDENAAVNIKMAGASAIGLGDVRRALPAIAV